MQEKLSLNDVGKHISTAKGWTERQVKGKENKGIIVIMAIKAPDKSVLVITDHSKTTKRKCRAIKEFIRRNND